MKIETYNKYYSQLIGKKVIAIVDDGDDEDDTTYGLEFDDGTIAWISMDPEGNGPGFLHID